MNMQARIESKLSAQLNPHHLQVINESDNHNVPPGSESHFKVVVVSDEFEGKALLARHRRVNAVLQEELQSGIHALALHTYTQQEWAQTQEGAPASPPCHGGGK